MCQLLSVSDHSVWEFLMICDEENYPWLRTKNVKIKIKKWLRNLPCPTIQKEKHKYGDHIQYNTYQFRDIWSSRDILIYSLQMTIISYIIS